MADSDLVFSGAKLQLKTGSSIQASATEFLSMQALKDGLYDISLVDAEINTPLVDREIFKGNRPSIKNNLLRISPVPPIRLPTLWASYIHDFRYTGLVSGIEVQPHFFKYISDYAQSRNKTHLRLRVDKGNKAPWMKTAIAEIGVKEISGSDHSARVLQYSKEAGYPLTTDDSDSPWCGAYVGWVMKKNGYIPPSTLVRAKEWKTFGRTVSEPTYGSIGIKSRSGGGHVAFVVGKNIDGDKLYMLGGNQNNAVNITEYDRSVFEAFTLPSTYESSDDWLPLYKKKFGSSESEA